MPAKDSSFTWNLAGVTFNFQSSLSYLLAANISAAYPWEMFFFSRRSLKYTNIVEYFVDINLENSHFGSNVY